MSESASPIELDEIRKEFDDVVAVDDQSLTIREGEFLVLLGPSGCGKSTTLRLIAGLETITSGEIRIGEEVVNQQVPADRDLAMVFQQIALYPHMTVYENIASPLRAANRPDEEIEEKATEVAGMLQISDLLDRKPSELSGGQQQRVAIGRALIRDPKAFLLDEPFSSLDAKLRTELQKEIKRLQDQLSVTSIFVTHDQEEAMVLADRIAVMNDGEIQQVDRPEQLYKNPANTFVAEFIGTPQMNFFDVSRRDTSLLIDDMEYALPEIDVLLEEATTLAARPEDITVSTNETASLSATVDLVEMHGSLTYLVCSLGGREITITKPEGENIDAGDEIELAFAFDQVNFYDSAGNLLE